MNIHSLARTTPIGRFEIVERVSKMGWTHADAAESAGISTKTVQKWNRRFRVEGVDGLVDRSSAPIRRPTRLPDDWRELIAELRRHRLTGKEIGAALQIPKATVHRVLEAHGLQRLKFLEPPEPVQRYEHKRPGSLVHLDVKKLGRIHGGVGHRITGDRRGHRGRGVGWEFVHVCIDDATRVAYVEILADEKAETTAAFFARAIRWFAKRGVRIRRVLTDNAFNYTHSKSFAALCSNYRIKHKRTRPYRPRTNGKAERFIQTLLREWAYKTPFVSSDERAAALRPYLARYNRSRPHQGLNGMTPFARLKALRGTTS